MKHLRFIALLVLSASFTACAGRDTEPEHHSGNIASQQSRDLETSGPAGAMPSPTP